jgi:cytochrome P450
MATALAPDLSAGAPELQGSMNDMRGPEECDRLDVTQPSLFTEYRWHEPFRQLREKGGIYYCENGRFGPYWSITTYKPIVHIEALPKVFSSSWEVGGITVAGDPEAILDGEVRMPMFIAMDPPQHTAQRRTVAPAFTPSEIERMKIECRARTAEVIDSLPVGETFDWVERVSQSCSTSRGRSDTI